MYYARNFQEIHDFIFQNVARDIFRNVFRDEFLAFFRVFSEIYLKRFSFRGSGLFVAYFLGRLLEFLRNYLNDVLQIFV